MNLGRSQPRVEDSVRSGTALRANNITLAESWHHFPSSFCLFPDTQPVSEALFSETLKAASVLSAIRLSIGSDEMEL